MIIERPFGIISVTRNLLNQFAISLENSRIGIAPDSKGAPAEASAPRNLTAMQGLHLLRALLGGSVPHAARLSQLALSVPPRNSLAIAALAPETWGRSVTMVLAAASAHYAFADRAS
jgi:hypothetical protein